MALDITGTLVITGQESRVNAMLLAICDASDPLSSATRFVKTHSLEDGDLVTVTGTLGSVGGVPVLCMTNVQAGGGDETHGGGTK